MRFFNIKKHHQQHDVENEKQGFYIIFADQ